MKQKRLFSDIFIYTLFGAVEKVLPFFILPFLTRMFSVEEVGYYTLYQTVIVLLVPIITCEVSTTISINYFHYDKDKFAKSMFNGIIACISIFVFSLFVLAMLGHPISTFINFPLRELWLSLLTIPFIFINDNLQILYRNQNKPISFGVFSSLRSITCYGIGLFLILILGWSWKSFVIGNLVGNFAFCIWTIVYLYKNEYVKICYDEGLFKENVKVGFPVSLHIVGTWLSNSLNQLLVNICIGIAATGMYGVGATFGMIMSFIQTSLNKAYIPLLYSNIKKKDYLDNKKMIKALYILIVVSFILVTLVGYFGVGLLFGKTYLDTRPFIMPLVLASTIQGLYKIHAAFLFYHKKTMSITKITLSLGLFNIPLAYIMLILFGITGVAYSSVIVWLVSYILIYIESKKVYDYKKV